MKTKFLFITGGTISGLGKGITAASLGNLLKANGHSVFVLKLDPYLNIDPGVMSPNEHGEVYVTEDGGETDLDLGHYERFIGVRLNKSSNYTSGKIYQKILTKERNGDYQGKTVQVVPHVTDEIISIILDSAKTKKPDFMIVEIGGTVGDIESNPFIYALAKFFNLYRKNSMLFYVTFVPYLASSKEYKSKPTQVSLSTLRGFGLNPDVLLLRSQGDLQKSLINKIATSSFIDSSKIISVPDLANIYKIPLFLLEQNILKSVFSYFKIQEADNFEKNLSPWRSFVQKVESEKEHELNVALVGKYTDLEDAYLSIIESLKIASIHNSVRLTYKVINADYITDENIEKVLKPYDSVMILPGFGARGFEGKVRVAAYTKAKKIPTFGVCLGFQAMVVAQARECGIKNANSAEFIENHKKETAVLDILPGKNKDADWGGTLRLGASDSAFLKDTLIYKIYKKPIVSERHRHRYEVTKKYVKQLEKNDFIFTGYSTNEGLAETCEVKNQKFYLGVQYHPEFNTTILEPHPLFSAFVKASIDKK
ncbi:CTP synthase [Mycoplasmopsis alligatoris]|uniref:CTP synthase (glutamine hydrolyzing) n=1 Tax=Mycoplasmopsis alligatoris A21JP2 TaxID=747682 RepID=D4XWD6_9BACT|nr:CTP synthase [Mycoplasmopsis alligatoris]EFF41212.1 CTP synthase [Mycoplasmopsis alligatoris A21JP2]